jgi:hypothetical protein
MNRSLRFFISALALGGLLALAGCGGGTGDNPNGGKAFNNGSGSGTSTGTTGGSTTGAVPAPVVPPPPVANAASLVITLADATTGAASTSVPLIARAIVRDDQGVAVPGAVVTFGVGSNIATLVPSAGTALTDATGTAAVRINAASLTSAGATTVSASSQVGGSAVSGSAGFQVGAANVQVTNFAFGTNPLPAFGTTSVSVTILSNGTPVTTPQTVTFTSPCSASGKAALTSSVLTINGVATASYRDNGCGGNDSVTASVSGLATASSTLSIAVPVVGSIQFVSASPQQITLKGTGGAGRVETSTVKFRVVDTNGTPLSTSQIVSFSLSNSVGGITFSNNQTTASANSDPVSGEAQIVVQAGTVATPVRVIATTTAPSGVVLSTQSDQLTITSGVPEDFRMSVSATKLNIEGWDYDGSTTVLTTRLGDHFGNPVPNGTAVTLVTEAGVIGQTGAIGSCTTSESECATTLESQGTRPSNGRVTVLAYALGEESFRDLDGDGLADLGELIDVNGNSSDLGEAFLDANENGTYDVGAESFIDFPPLNGSRDTPDGKYNGVLCDETVSSSAGTCASQKTLNIYRNKTIVFSGSTAQVAFYDISGGALNVIPAGTGLTFPLCQNGVQYTPGVATFLVTVNDVNGNVMPVGTTVSFSASNGTITSTPTSFTIPNSIACRADGGVKCPTSSEVPLTTVADNVLSFEVVVKSAQTQDNTLVCTYPATSPGRLNVTVTTPEQNVVTNRNRGITN